MLPHAYEGLTLLPWLILTLTLPLMLLRRTRLSAFQPPSQDEAPMVSIIVPARDEAVNISTCVASLLNTEYPRYEIIVVDDGSVDGTGDIVRILSDHTDERLQLITGEPLPDGWLGKPWACWQGAQRARGELLLFTDADTRHEEALLGHAVGAMQKQGADLVSVFPRQLMVGFWERLILPHIFAILTLRYSDLDRVNRTRRPRNVIANGQFILVSREAYDSVGGHEALRAEVVEDQRLAQRLVADGRTIFIGHAQKLMDTRMYRSLGGIVEGWSKNLALGSRQAAPAWAGPMVPWFIAAFLICVWVVPQIVLLLALTTPLGGDWQTWSLTVTALCVVFWTMVMLSMRVPALFSITFPFGAAVAAALFVRSALRGTHVEWKGRHYDVAAVSDLAGPAPDPAHGP
ncbi:hydroxychlorobactene glucosyltransferase CruC [soil metagenome]